MPATPKPASSFWPALALCTGVVLIVLELRSEASIFWIVLGVCLIVLAIVALAFRAPREH